MNVLFIHIGPDDTYPVSIGALSAFLVDHGHRTKLVDLVSKEPDLTINQFTIILQALEKFSPSLVGFTVFETGFHWVQQVSDIIKNHKSSILTIAGGYSPTLMPEEIIKHPSIDIVCRGEGEYPLLELVQNLEKKEEITNIKNLWVKKGENIYKNEIRPLIEDLDNLPFWDRKMFDYQQHLDLAKKGERNVKVMASRGCPYHCTYCSNHYFKELYPNKKKYLRMRSVDHLIKELTTLKKEYDFDYVGFHDDNLTLFSTWLDEFSEKYQKNIGIPFYCAARVETCTDKTLDALKKAGCFMVLIGLESGDEQYRKERMNRKMSNKVIIDACNRIKKRGMLLWTFNMVGLPGESRKQMYTTVLLNWQIVPDFAMTSIFYPFKGTQMGDLCYQEGLIDFEKKKRLFSYANDTILKDLQVSTFEIRLAKYLTVFSAIRSKNSFFTKALLDRVRKLAPWN